MGKTAMRGLTAVAIYACLLAAARAGDCDAACQCFESKCPNELAACKRSLKCVAIFLCGDRCTPGDKACLEKCFNDDPDQATKEAVKCGADNGCVATGSALPIPGAIRFPKATPPPLEVTLIPSFAQPKAQTHYGDPLSGPCESDEKNVSIQGVPGAVCTPACTGIFKTKCPTDVPSGVTATPTCALQDASSGAKYCALICSPSVDLKSLRAGDAQCGSASCQPISGTGICTYTS